MHKRFLVALVAALTLFAGVVSAQDRAFMGIAPTPTADNNGVLVDAVVTNSPAEAAGLMPGDIIISVNGTSVTFNSIWDVVELAEPGEPFELVVQRNGEMLTLGMALAQRDDNQLRREFGIEQPNFDEVGRPFMGIAISDEEAGVVVQDVLPGSPAMAAGFQDGDVVLTFNGIAVMNSDMLVDVVLSNIGTIDATVGILRNGTQMDITLTLAAIMDAPMAEINPVDFIMYDRFENGWQVFGLAQDSALREMGLREGDMITAVDGMVRTPEELQNYLNSLAGNATVTLTLERNGGTAMMKVDVSALRDVSGIAMQLPNLDGAPGPEQMGRLGVEFANLNEEVALNYGVAQASGAYVVSVLEGTPADAIGFEYGDIVTAVDGVELTAEVNFRDRLMAIMPNTRVNFDVLRDGETIMLTVVLREIELPMRHFVPAGE